MRKKMICLFSICILGVLLLQAQTDNYLQDIAKVVKELRKSNNMTRNSAIAVLSADQKPKITLMDEIEWAGDREEKSNEVKGAKDYRFKLNLVVADVYKKQNHLLESKSSMLNGNEKDIHYSLIEKNIKRGGKVTYKLKGRKGEQDFVFIPYNPKSKYVVTMYVNDVKVDRKEVSDVCQIHLRKVSSKQEITFSINYLDDKSNKNRVESFAILNYNQQK